MAGKATWPEIQRMTLDDVDLQCLLLDALDHGEPAQTEGEIIV